MEQELIAFNFRKKWLPKVYIWLAAQPQRVSHGVQQIRLSLRIHSGVFSD